MTPPPPNNIRVRLHDVALRYDRARRRRGNTINFIGRQRLRDLGRLFTIATAVCCQMMIPGEKTSLWP